MEASVVGERSDVVRGNGERRVFAVGGGDARRNAEVEIERELFGVVGEELQAS